MNAESLRASLLVDTGWLAGHLDDGALRVVDMRGLIKPPSAPKPWYLSKRAAYLESHVPGAVFVDWTEDIVEPEAPVPMTLALPDRFKALMERLGIGDDSEVVVYDDNGALAPRLWWALKHYGHGRVRLLDGGWGKWVAEGRPVSAAPPSSRPAVFTPRPDPAWRAGIAQVKGAITGRGPRLLDCRTPEEWRGDVGRGERKGRIPGSVNVPAVGALGGDPRTWKDGRELSALYAAAGITPDRPVITYCNAGVSASAGLFALKLAGFRNVSNFAGSWYEWEQDPTSPVETG